MIARLREQQTRELLAPTFKRFAIDELAAQKTNQPVLKTMKTGFDVDAWKPKD